MLSTLLRSEYPFHIRRIVNTIWILVLGMNVIEYALAWARVLYSLFTPMLQLPFISILTSNQDTIRILLVAHIGLFAALLTTRAIAFLSPRVTLRNDGLLIKTALEWRFIPYTALRGVRSVELRSNNRYVVWIDSARGLPLQSWLASLLFGRRLTSGLLLTSDLASFDTVMATITDALRIKYPKEQDFAAHFIEGEPTWLLSMLNSPHGTIRAVVAAEAFPIDMIEARWQIASVALSLLLPLVVGGIIHLQIPWGALLVLIIALIEFPLASYLLSAVLLGDYRRIDFSHALRVYPLTQLPRWSIAMGLTLLIIAGAPSLIILFSVAFAIMLGCAWVLWLARAWFEVSFGEALIGIVATALLQFILYVTFFISIPWS
jgi:hypothetical protein